MSFSRSMGQYKKVDVSSGHIVASEVYKSQSKFNVCKHINACARILAYSRLRTKVGRSKFGESAASPSSAQLHDMHIVHTYPSAPSIGILCTGDILRSFCQLFRTRSHSNIVQRWMWTPERGCELCARFHVVFAHVRCRSDYLQFSCLIIPTLRLPLPGTPHGS